MPLREIPDTFVDGWGERLAQARKALRPKKTQADFGSVLGIRNTAYSRYEVGDFQPGKQMLSTLKTAFGINPRFVALGEEPMILPTWNMDLMRSTFNGLAGVSVDGLWIVQEAHGMSSIQPGDLLSWHREENLCHGEVYIVAPPKVPAENSGIASPRCCIGRAIQTEIDGKTTWRLYRDDDASRPGSFPPLEINNWTILGRVVLITRPF